MKFHIIKYFFLLILLSGLFHTSNCLSQKTFKISGFIKNVENNHPLIGAELYTSDSTVGTISGKNGKYNLRIKEGEYILIVSHIGYKTAIKNINVNKNIAEDFYLQKEIVEIDNIEISSTTDNENLNSAESGIVKITSKEMKNLPVLLGEPDIIKAFKLTPGVQLAGEGNSGIYVRGGGPGQNLILLDENTIYNPNHLFGFFSVFNADVIKNAKLIKAGIPANYGNRASSVIEVTTKEGNFKKPVTYGSIGVVTSRITTEGPVLNKKGSYLFSGRRSYLGFVKPIISPIIEKSLSFFNDTKYHFSDFNAKLYYKFSNKDRLWISGYYGRDKYILERSTIDFNNYMNWGNNSAIIKWNHIFNHKFSVNNIIGYTSYLYQMKSNFSQYELQINSKINDWTYKQTYNWIIAENQFLKFGLEYVNHQITPNNVYVESLDFDYKNLVKIYAHETSFFISDAVKLSDKINFIGGLRYTNYLHTGPYTTFRVNETNLVIDTISYPKNQVIKSYNRIEPRFSINFKLNKLTSFKGSYTNIHQFIHLASVGAITLPIDIWMPSTDLIKPQNISQISFSLLKNIPHLGFETSIDIYYKNMLNQIEFKNSLINNLDNTTIEDRITFGKGKAYGAEFFVKKKEGSITGWIGYTISKTTKQFEEINNGNAFYAKYDRRHDLSIYLLKQLNNKWTFSAVFVYATGNAMTLPVGRYMIQGYIVNDYMATNSFRMPPYHRLDISATYIAKKTEKITAIWNFSVYNVYNRSNPYYIFFNASGNIDDYSLKIEAEEISLFPIIPSISWTFKF